MFGLLKRSGRVYMLPIPNAKAKTLMPIIESRAVLDGIVYIDSFASYDILDVSLLSPHFEYHFLRETLAMFGCELLWRQAS